MKSQEVVIIDSGICNLFNVKGALKSLGAHVIVSRKRSEILGAPRLILPGVGSFGAGINSLAQFELIETVRSFAKSGKPILGICLGMQMLLSVSEEFGVWDGLSLISGRVRRFTSSSLGKSMYKVPQIGWNSFEENSPWDQTILRGLVGKPYAYFVHSFIAIPENSQEVLAVTTYGQDRFASVLRKENISGCQFHPERSGQVGLQILRNFLTET